MVKLSAGVVFGLVQAVETRSRAEGFGVPDEPMRRTMNGSSCGTFDPAASCSARAGLWAGQRLGGVPVHQRQVGVVGVLAVGEPGRPACPSDSSAASRCSPEAR